MTPAWFRWYHGTITDPKWRRVARAAAESVSVTVRDVIAVWAALLEHASQSRPRGSIATFNVEDAAEALAWEPGALRAVLLAMQLKGLHDGQSITKWADRQRGKRDETSAARSKRYRDNKAASRRDGDQRHGVTEPEQERHAVTETDRHGVTNDQRHGGDIGGVSLSVGEASNLPILDNSTSAATRASEIVTVEQSLQALSAAGAPVGWFTGASRLAKGWVEAGLTAPQLAEAIKRAQASRAKQGDSSPVTPRFVACMVSDVLAGRAPLVDGKPAAPRSANGSSPERPPEDPTQQKLAWLDRLHEPSRGLQPLEPGEYARRRADILAGGTGAAT